MTSVVDVPLISIVIPVYNHAAYIVDCLNSVLLDDYSNKEIIILDDGSTDNSIAVIQTWLTQNPSPVNIQRILFLTQENKGLCAVLNRMISQACGEYIRPLSGDDRLIPGMLKQHLKYIANYPSKIAAFADAHVIDAAGTIISLSALTKYLPHPKSAFTGDRALKKFIILKGRIIPNLLIRKSFYDYFQYPTEINIEDNYFFLILAAKNQLIFFDAIVADYRVHGSNASYKLSWKEPVARTKQRIKIIKAQLQSYLKAYSAFSIYWRSLILYASFKTLIKIVILQCLLAYKKFERTNQ